MDKNINKDSIRAVKFNKEKTTMYCLRLNKVNDKDIIDHLNSLPNKLGYLKNLIRQDIEKGTNK